MLVRQVKNVARQWVDEEASKVSGFFGAFFIGSINRMTDDTLFPSTSDVDVIMVTEDPNPPDHRKFPYQNIVLEVSYIPQDRIQSPDDVLGSYTLAVHFTTPNIISDPTGKLTKIQATVSRDYARRRWVLKRCERARDLILDSLQWLKDSDPFHDQVFAWLYPPVILAHIVLVSALQNPTVRKCFVASREVLTHYDQLPLHEDMLGVLGSAHMSRVQVEQHLASCAEVFDVAKGIVNTPFFFASDISDYARPTAIDGSRELIENGDHREAVYWIAVTQSFCQKILFNDAPTEIQDRFMPGFRYLLSDLGIMSFADLKQRNEQVIGLLPRVWEVAGEIISSNPQIVE